MKRESEKRECEEKDREAGKESDILINTGV